ncbi:MAG: ParB/RepB/Spo0J family partition protein [Firmicutes bacterium]|nr:ParB/RepB/Spo0J family partition protein [Candidatus Fermentithermobacillaceae bacterium]
MLKRGLGRGIDSLIPPVELEPGEAPVEIAVSEIDPNPFQPRREFNQESLEELAASVREHGVLQPLIVRRVGSRFQLVAGERRLRAAQMAGLARVPAVVRTLDDRQVMILSLVENLQREDLGPLEQAEAFRRLIEEFGLTQEQAAEQVGKSRSEVANTLRLLKLEPEAKKLLEEGKITAGHARVLVGLEPERQREIARMVASRNLTVRQVEELVYGRKKERGARGVVRIREAEEVLAEALGSPVVVQRRGNSGTISIQFFGDEDLERLVGILTGRGGA